MEMITKDGHDRIAHAGIQRLRTKLSRRWRGFKHPGWHRLDPTWAERIVAGAAIGRGEVVVDLGAGVGALTLASCPAGVERKNLENRESPKSPRR
jgi:tRNA A58 N-methylase Trm61